MADNKPKGKRVRPNKKNAADNGKDTRFNISSRDPRWQNASKSKIGLDPFGRKVEQSTRENLERFYHIDEKDSTTVATSSDLTKQEQEKGDDHEVEDQGPIQGTQLTKETKKKGKAESKRKEEDQEEEREEEREEEEEEEEAEESEEREEEEEAEAEETKQGQNVVAYVEGDDIQETRRLAICRCDWENIRAVDLLVLLQSFVPSTGAINSVAIYPSKYGKQKEEKEYQHGPSHLWEGSDDDGSEINTKKLRQYELDKLNYFYAVVECDSVQTGADLYRACDGIELERTGNIIDMSFVPDDTTFDLPPREVAREVPSSYKPPDAYSKVLQHTRVDLTWDADDPHRMQLVKRARISADELRLADFKDYLASESEESDSDSDAEGTEEQLQGKPKIDPKKRQRFAALLREVEGNKSEESPNMDMEITFMPGLSKKVESMLQVKDDPAALKKRKRKQEKLSKKMQKQEDEHSEQEEQMLDSEEEERETRKKRKKSATNNKKKNDTGKEAAELELLMMDETLGAKPKNNKKDEESASKTKKGKKKSKKEKQSNVEADLSDTRFQELLYSSDFALDPTRLKKVTPTMQKIQTERARLQADPQARSTATSSAKVEASQSFKDPSIAALVSSVKTKATKSKKPQQNQAAEQKSSKQKQAATKQQPIKKNSQ